MKKVFIAAAAVAMFSLTSCNKEKDCTCVTTQNGTEVSTVKTTIEDGECSDSNLEQNVGGQTQKITCTED